MGEKKAREISVLGGVVCSTAVCVHLERGQSSSCSELRARLAGRRNNFSGIVDFEVRWRAVGDGGLTQGLLESVKGFVVGFVRERQNT